MTRQDPGDFDPRNSMIPPGGCLPPSFIIVAFILFGVLCLIIAWPASAHEATSVDGQPLGWKYPWACCSGMDCAPIRASSVQQLPEGYKVTLHKGDHPFATSDTPLVYEIPYSDKRIKDSPDGAYHICIRTPNAASGPLDLLCFYRGPEGF